MKILIKNLGIIKQAEFTLGELTVICGENNTGKTYATHAVYGFFDFLRSSVEFEIDRKVIDKLLDEGSVSLPLSKYTNDLQEMMSSAAKQYSKIIFRVFAGREDQFETTSLLLDMEFNEPSFISEVKIKVGSAKRTVLQINSSEDKSQLDISLIVDKEFDDIPPRHILQEMICDAIRAAVLEGIIPKPFIASAERTGAAIFQRELDFTKNRLVELLGDKSTKIHPIEFLSKFSGEYPIVVRKNVDFIRSLPDITHRDSFIKKNYPEILESFSDIIGGEYKVNKDGEVQFVPSSNRRVKLTLVESSSAVRSLLDIGFYLRHIAAQGDLLMVDEPELNLHPENQRRVARLLAQLVNIGIKVFITTHSDYIVKELNTLIMLNQDIEYLRNLAAREHYEPTELLSPEKVRVYIAEDSLLKLDGAIKKRRYPTLVEVEIDRKYGIEARTFDKTIEDMNRIQDEIVWGGDE